MFQNVPIPDSLLNVVNTDGFLADTGPGMSMKCLVITGALTFFGLMGVLVYRLSQASDAGAELARMRGELARVLRSTLVVRLCMIQAMLVIPLIFYVNTKEHYWTSKHTTMLLISALGIGAWLAVRWFVPRFRIPYTWPLAFIMLGGALSMFAAVNMAEGMGDLFAIFGSAAFTFLGAQAFSTSKRIHLVAVAFLLVAAAMSIYGLCQAYLFLPLDQVYAADTRAPVSTIGNKNYAAYYLDLALPLLVALAVTRRSPLQTIAALAVYFICRWHFVLCDTRGGTISITVGILLTTVMVGIFHGRKFRLLLYLVLLEPLMWAALTTGGLDYTDTQQWGKLLNLGVEKKAINQAMIDNLTPEAASIRSYIGQWFFKGNEYYLGIPSRLYALLLGTGIALGVFWFLVTRVRNWRYQLLGAALLAFLPYWFVVFGTFPGAMLPERAVAKVIEGLQVEQIPNIEIATQFMNKPGMEMMRAAGPYNQMILGKHRDMAAQFAFSMFMAMAVFLLYRWYDQEGGWLPCFATVGTAGLWFLVYLMLLSRGSPLDRLLHGLFKPLDHLWPIGVDGLTESSALMSLILSPVAFAIFSLGTILVIIAATQYLPTIRTREEMAEIKFRGAAYGRYAAITLTVVAFLLIVTNGKVQRVASTIWRTSDEGVVRALFYGAHAFFNTQGEFAGPSDNPIGFRLEIYQGTLRKMLDNPILGVGPGNFKVINPHPKYETALERRILGKEVLGRHPHNDFIEDATDSGSLAFLGMIWIFGTALVILYRSLKLVHVPRNGTDAFINTITWGLFWAITGILIHAQFEMPLLQPSSTYPAWFLLGVCFQLRRVHLRRIRAVASDSPLLAAAAPGNGDAESLLAGVAPSRANAALYELPSARPAHEFGIRSVSPWVSWPIMLALVTLLMGSTLIRQFVGEMWLRWGMIFSEPGVERYDYVFTCMEKSQDIYPLEMETNYILGRYCIDATSKVFRPWLVKHRSDLYNSPKEQEQNELEIREIKQEFKLDVDKIVDYAQLGVDVHIRDVFMNPNYKWAHNNMGVLYDKMNQIYETLAVSTKTPEERAKYLGLANGTEDKSQNCYSIALEIDDLQVYALFNLGHGALRDQNIPLALKYFERTLLADPNRQDVNLQIAKCRFQMKNFSSGLEAIEKLYAWMDKRPSNRIEAFQEEELETVLHQVARATVVEDPDTAVRAGSILIDRFDRCAYLPMQAHAVVNAGSPTEALVLAAETLSKCGDRVSGEVVYAQAKAFSLAGNATGALSAFQSLMKSPAGTSFKPYILNDPAFDSMRENQVYKSLMGSATAAAPKPVTPPAAAVPVVEPATVVPKVAAATPESATEKPSP